MPREASARGGGDAPPPTLMKKISRRLSNTFGWKSRNQESFYSAWAGDRWNKGRHWNGLDDWCDPQTASEAVEWLEENFNLNDSLLKYTDAMAARFPDKRAITYVDGKGREQANYSFAEVKAHASRIAAFLQNDHGLVPGDAALIIIPPGQEFLFAFLGCIMAGVIAVPVYPPHPLRFEAELPKLLVIVENCKAKIALTDAQYNMVIKGVAAANTFSKFGMGKRIEWPNLPTVRTDKIRTSYSKKLLHVPTRKGADVCFLQYTSGTTGDPKGVEVTHGNLIATVRALFERTKFVFGYDNNINMVSWLPMYHDMGLIGTCLVGLVSGTHMISMTPIAFLQDPTQWLVTCSLWKAQVSTVPGFAFHLVCRKTNRALRDSLNLHPLKMITCGAGVIRPEVLEEFLEYFKPAKLHDTTIVPAYGLAEYTLCATAHSGGAPISTITVHKPTLQTAGTVRLMDTDRTGRKNAADTLRLLGVGKPAPDGTTVLIVDPETREDLGEGKVGEVWVDGPCKALGYHGDKKGTIDTFGGVVSGQEGTGKRWLRTGDEGFLYRGELFIVGRMDTLIKLDQRAMYPWEIEAVLEEALDGTVKPGHTAAVVDEASRGLLWVAELKTKLKERDAKPAAEKAKQIIQKQFNLPVSAVVLLEPRALPKTNSGQVQHLKCRDQYHDGKLKACVIVH